MSVQYYPFCVILTHRHGAGIGIFTKDSQLIKKDFLETATSYLSQKTKLVCHSENIEYLEEKGSFFIARALGKTAENLYNLYQFVNKRFEKETSNIVVGIGPGSFTGLRLGCAFVNGLNLSKPKQLFSIKTLLRDELSKIFVYDKSLGDELDKECGEYRESDPASGFITFFDLFFAYFQVQQNQAKLCATLIPEYGREPTPVLNLRKEKK